MALASVKCTYDNGDVVITDYNAECSREEIAKYFMFNWFDLGSLSNPDESELHQCIKVEFPY